MDAGACGGMQAVLAGVGVSARDRCRQICHQLRKCFSLLGPFTQIESSVTILQSAAALLGGRFWAASVSQEFVSSVEFGVCPPGPKDWRGLLSSRSKC